MQPGIYQGMPAAQYHALPYVSNSYLKRLAKCPANAKVVDQEETRALLFGRGAHVMTLEGDNAFNSEFIILPEDAPKKPSDRQRFAKKPSPETVYACDWWDNFTRNANGKTTLSREDYDTLRGVRDSVRSHPFAKLLLAEGVSETTVIFDLAMNGQTVRCKCRPDRTPSPEMATLLDLKTTEDASYDAFLRSCFKFGYITQAAFYIDGYNAVRGDLPEMDAFAFIAVEKKAPYRCEVYTVDRDFLKWGQMEYQRLLKIETECRAQGSWPAYQNAGADDLIKPAWLAA